MNRPRPLALLLTAILSAAPITGIAEEDPDGRLLDCRRHTDNAARLACYDELADRLASSAAAGEEEGSRSSAANATRPTPAAAVDDAQITVTVVDCRRLHDNDYLFTLANGESWRQTSSRRLRMSNCQFEATITRDVFGHKMTFDHNGRSVRIKQVE